MKHFRLGWLTIARALLFSATAFLVCGTALAQVNGFVVVNPIVVCDSNGANCPPFGALCSTNAKTGAYTCTQSTSPSTATVNTPIGFVDGDTNTNLTRAILAAQAGIDVAFFPVQQYNSPNTNTDPWPKISPGYLTSPTNYQHLHLKTVTCKDGTAITASPDLAALTQHQICTEHKGVPSGVSNPPPSPSPAPPLGSTLGESNALDLFIVTDFNQTVFGESWINGDGVSVAGPPTFLVTGPRFDNFAHEIGHALALDHTGYGLTTSITNLMTTGSSRFVPSSSGCVSSKTNPLGGGFPNLNGGELYDLGDTSVVPASCTPAKPPVADLLVQPSGSGSTCTLSTGSGPICADQVSALSLSPFINKTLAGTATAGGGAAAVASSATAGDATQATVAGAATTTTCPPPGGVPFAISAAPGTGENGDAINSVIIALSPASGLEFSGSSPATQTPCGTGGVNIINQVRLNGNSGIGNSNCVKSINLAPPSVQCLQIFFSFGDSQGAAFVAGDTVTFNVAFNQDNATQLAGSQLTVITSTPNQPSCTSDPTNCVAYSTTTTFEIVNGVVQADSRFPDFTTPNQINPNFVNAAVVRLGKELSKCTPPYTGSGPHQQCPGGSLPVGPD